MICKKCGAYNPDHATFCKVCAANLKDQTDTDENAQVTDSEEVVDKELRPRRGNVKAPDFSAARRPSSFKPVQEPEEDEEEDEDVQEPEEEEEEVKPARKPLFSRTAPANKRRIVDDEEDEDDEDDDDEDEDEYDEDEGDKKKLESEPKTTRFSRSSRKNSRIVEEEEDDEDEDDDEDEEDGYDDDSYEDDEEEDDGYEEYEPTPPRRKKSSRGGNGRSGGPNIIVLLIVCLLAILLIIVGIVAFCNIKGGETKAKLPRALQINCAGKQAATETDLPTQPTTQQDVAPTDAPVTGLPVDYSLTTLEEVVDSDGMSCIKVSLTARPGDVVTVVLPNQDDFVKPNNEAVDQPYELTIPKACFFPNKPLTDSIYTVTPQILVAHADGTQESLQVDSFDITFPTIQLELEEPVLDTIPEEGLMAAEGNVVLIKGKVDDHTVTVTVNGQPVAIYEGGTFEYNYTLANDEGETVSIEANKANYVSASCSFVATPYVFIPEQMPLSVVTEVDKLRADKNNRVTVTGKTAPGATLTATPAAEYTSFVACGSPTVDPEGNYSFDVTFGKDYYGIASITIHAKKDGYEEGEISCVVSRMYATKDKAISGYSRAKAFYEVPTKYEFSKVLENPAADGLYRFVGKIVEINPETGVITFEAKTSYKETAKIYVLNAVAGWDATKYVGKSFKLYCTLNGLYEDGTSLYVTAWFQMKD